MAEERDLSIPQLLCLKTSTSGLFRKDLPLEDPAQPFALEIAAALCNRSGAITSQFAHVINPDGRVTQKGALEIHGVSTRAASQIGIPEPRVLGTLADMLKTPVVTGLKVISFNEFDPRIISSLFARFAVSKSLDANVYDKLWRTRPSIEFISLQDPWCTQACRLQSEDREDYRWPALSEATEIMLGRSRTDGYHDALSGVQAVRDLYLHLDRKGAFAERVA